MATPMTLDVQQAIEQQYKAHSLTQVSSALELIKLDALEARHALIVASHLVNHGISNAGRYLKNLRSQLSNEWALGFISRLEQRHKVIQQLPGLSARLHDPEALQQFYSQHGYHFVPGTTRPDIAIVIFTTVYNNFGFSNVVMDAALAELGTARLYLKDTSVFYYMKGVRGLARDMRDLPAGLEKCLQEHGINRYLITGFSSGGYASLYTAARTSPMAYVGFSIVANLSETTLPEAPRYYRDLRENQPADLFMSTDELMAPRQPSCPYVILHGDQAPKDKLQAEFLSPFPNVTVREIADCNHEVTSALLERNTFTDVFRDALGTE